MSLHPVCTCPYLSPAVLPISPLPEMTKLLNFSRILLFRKTIERRVESKLMSLLVEVYAAEKVHPLGNQQGGYAGTVEELLPIAV